MTKMQALNTFFSGFGLKAYEENALYAADPVLPLPYITYTVNLDNFYAGPTACVMTVWYRTSSWKELEEKQDAIAEDIGISGKVLPVDGGYIWIKRGKPFATPLGDPADKLVKRIVLNLSIEFETAI